ncbi:MAG: hypothetical protein CL569_05035 [Alphaproteobacteria bacterium]|nr:hypothetical protein [Alphaproteobacteria bacterium]|tara:strand:+ start:65 stop:646 length:582 start_codon:yes stop_codon:yes gene_type:complete
MEQLNLFRQGTPTTHLLGIHGPDGVGKTSLARAAQNLDGRVRVLSVGGPIKQKAAGAVDLPPARVEQNKAVLRTLLRSVGTTARDLHGKDHWLKKLAEQYATLPVGSIGIIDDIRTDSEAQWVKDQGGSVITLYRKGEVPTEAEKKEMLLEDIEADLIVWNDFGRHSRQLEAIAKGILWGDSLQKAERQMSAA